MALIDLLVAQLPPDLRERAPDVSRADPDLDRGLGPRDNSALPDLGEPRDVHRACTAPLAPLAPREERDLKHHEDRDRQTERRDRHADVAAERALEPQEPRLDRRAHL